MVCVGGLSNHNTTEFGCLPTGRPTLGNHFSAQSKPPHCSTSSPRLDIHQHFTMVQLSAYPPFIMSSVRLEDTEKEPITPSERTLRIIPILDFIPALALLIPHAVANGGPCPAIGLAPAFISLCFGIAQLTTKTRHHRLDFLLDSFLTAFYQGVLIASWVIVAKDESRSRAVLGAYATMPLMVNL